MWEYILRKCILKNEKAMVCERIILFKKYFYFENVTCGVENLGF